jgi:hypothetical protein
MRVIFALPHATRSPCYRQPRLKLQYSHHSLNIIARLSPFKATITVVTWKPVKNGYTPPTSYRPIALFNTRGKVLEAIVANRLAFLADTYLPPIQPPYRRPESWDELHHDLNRRIRADEADAEDRAQWCGSKSVGT